MMELTTLRDIVSIGSPFVAVVGAGYLVWYRLGRIEHILSNSNGLVQRMERMEREAEMRAEATKSEAEQSDPTRDPDNVRWMEEQLRIGKTVHGETFGEDIDESFE